MPDAGRRGKLAKAGLCGGGRGRNMACVFTGIIQHVGRVVSVTPTAAGKRLRVDVGPLAGRAGVGASIAVDGACLTVSAVSGSAVDFDAVPETLERTTLGLLAAGAAVNLEPALAAGDALDGHIVQGHVDCIAEVERVEKGSSGHVLHLTAGVEFAEQMVPKGSVALAGVSLTLAGVGRGRLSVALVPTTLAKTTLAGLKPADRLNLEVDVLGKYVRKYLQSLAGSSGGLSIEKLREAGFA